MKKLLLFTLICSFSMLYAQDENPYHISCDPEKDGENCAVVLAVSGLKIRAKPSFEGKSLTVVPQGGKITRLATDVRFDNVVFTPDSISGNWERVRYGKIEGYAFNAFFGEGIRKIKDKYTLLIENAASCWNDCYASTKEHYNYYALLQNAKKNDYVLQKFLPTFACSQGENGISIICPDKRPSKCILVTQEEIAQGAVQCVDKQEVIKGQEENSSQEVNRKVKIPETNWVLEVKTEKVNNNGYEYEKGTLVLRDTKSGIKQSLSAKDQNCSGAILIWCGDIDRDGIMDFLIETSEGDEGGGTTLYLSRDVPKGKLVKFGGSYSYEDCC